MESQLFTPEQREEIKNIVREALVEFFGNIGNGTKFWLLTVASVVGALLVIFGGLKTLFAFFGIGYIGK